MARAEILQGARRDRLSCFFWPIHLKSSARYGGARMGRISGIKLAADYLCVSNYYTRILSPSRAAPAVFGEHALDKHAQEALAKPPGKTDARSERFPWEWNRDVYMEVKAPWNILFCFLPSSSRIERSNEDMPAESLLVLADCRLSQAALYLPPLLQPGARANRTSPPSLLFRPPSPPQFDGKGPAFDLNATHTRRVLPKTAVSEVYEQVLL